MGESGEPWGTPAVTGISAVCWPSKWRTATLPVSQALTQSTSHLGKPCSRRVASSRVWLTVSNAPEISNCSSEAAALCL